MIDINLIRENPDLVRRMVQALIKGIGTPGCMVPVQLVPDPEAAQKFLGIGHGVECFELLEREVEEHGGDAHAADDPHEVGVDREQGHHHEQPEQAWQHEMFDR